MALKPLILASSSPRRRALLTEAGYRFLVAAPVLDEPDEVLGKLTPAQQAESLAYFKARTIGDLHPEAYVLGADTIVALGRRVLGKPSDAAEARQMLTSLGGTRHIVITGVALLGPNGERIIASDATYVTMRPMTSEELDQYIASGEWMGKAGAYAIQETADRFVTKVEGSFSNVVGLPVEMVQRMLRELEEHPEKHRVMSTA